MKKVSDVLIQARDIYWIDADDTIRQAAKYMAERKTGAVAVKQGDDVVGIFSERDVLHRVVAEGLDLDTTKVQEVMSESIISINLDDEIHLAKSIMINNRVRHLLVVGRGNQLKGLVSMRDLLQADIADTKERIHELNDHYYEKAYKARIRTAANRVIVEPYVPQ